MNLSEGLEKAIWDILYSEAVYTELDLEDEETVDTIVKVLQKVGEDLVLWGCSEEEKGE
tara:strand:+ start:10 stop:186 length:177 start_codon:yes stop_codon:yes gene_type:complete